VLMGGEWIVKIWLNCGIYMEGFSQRTQSRKRTQRGGRGFLYEGYAWASR